MKKWHYCRFCGKWSYMEPTTVVRCSYCGKDITFPNEQPEKRSGIWKDKNDSKITNERSVK